MPHPTDRETTMKLIRVFHTDNYPGSVVNEGGYIQPADDNDLGLFMHCAGGMIAVTGRKFDGETSHVLKAHGINWEIEDQP